MNLARKHTCHNVCNMSTIYHWSLWTFCLYCGYSFTTIKTHGCSRSGQTCTALSRNTQKVLCYKFMRLIIKDHLSMWLQKNREAESLDQRGEMCFWCEQPGCCSPEICHNAVLHGASASCASPALQLSLFTASVSHTFFRSTVLVLHLPSGTTLSGCPKTWQIACCVEAKCFILNWFKTCDSFSYKMVAGLKV